MRPRAASSAEHSDTSRPVADVRTSSFSFQAKASRFLKNVSNFARGKKNSSNTCPYNNTGRPGQSKAYLSQPALVMSDLSPMHDESSSSVSPSPLSGSPPNSGAPSTSGAGSRSLDLTNGGRREIESAPLTSVTKARLPLETISHDGRSPHLLTLPTTSPTPGRSVSFDIPRPLFIKDDKTSKPSGFETMSPRTNPGNLADVYEESSPHSLPNVPGNGVSSVADLPSYRPKIEGLPNPTEPTDPGFFACAQPAGQSSADEVPTLTPDRTPIPTSCDAIPPKPPNYHEAMNSPMLTPANLSPALLPPKRVALLRLSSLPPPAFTMNDEDGSVRFSPTPIARHFPTAVLPLPPASIARRSTSPVPSLTSTASHTRLRNIPALARDGSEDGGGEGSDGEDGDDDDQMPATSPPASEDEDDDATTEREDSSTYVSAAGSPAEPHHSSSGPSGFADVEKTPVSRPPQDYFSVQPSRSESVKWSTSGPNSRRTSLTPRERPSALYHQPSKSMINLLSNQRRDLSVIDEETKGKGKATDSVSSTVAIDNNVLPEGSRIQRRRSLPMFTTATEPPPYPSLEIPTKFTPKVFPRDEEGKEQLPGYSNGIYLSAVLPRKVEFSSPGVQARDRKWRRMLCVLEGTAFRVFEPPASAVGIGAVGRWWEKRVGVGDLTSDAPLPKKSKPTTLGSQKFDRDLDSDEDRSTLGLASSIATSERENIHPGKKPKLHSQGLLHRSGNSSGTSSRRQSGETARDDGRSGISLSAPRPSMSTATSVPQGRSSVSSHRRAGSPTPTMKSSQRDYVPHPQNCQSLRVYTLQHAESGLASDYLKRKNVIRVRMEGEQFLLQAPDVQAVVDWIEGFQTATGIALDLDERQMPKGPMFPRRRRRRVRLPNNPNPSPQTEERAR